MKLFYAPGACSIGIHVLLEEIGKPYDSEVVNLREGAQFKEAFTTVNPKSKVPTLVRDDGVVQLLDYCVATIHMQGFSRLFRASNFSPNPADEEAVKARGREIVEKGFA